MKMSDPRTSRRDVLKMASAGTAAMSLAGLLRAAETSPSEPPAKQILVDFSKELGRIKPLHGVCNGPINWGGRANLTLFHREAGFPHVRLHDVNFPDTSIVDIPGIFPLFHANPDDPANYLFAKSDAYIKPIVDLGAQITYRLGAARSIEQVGHFDARAPKDFAKWARICVNIIRHYNEGWAGGFHYNIRYWEIWNEPNGKNMWSGTREQYFELYETATKAIKAHAPSVKVGGPAFSNPRSPWVRPFLQHCRDRKVPLDFCSWHQYSDSPVEMKKAADLVRGLLDEFGFKDTENHLTEWHYLNCAMDRLRPPDPHEYVNLRALYDGMGGPQGAAYCATVLMLLQDSGIDVADYYSADTLRMGMFDSYGVPRKTYYAFRAFNELSKTPRRVACMGGTPDGTLTTCAGLSNDGTTANILVSNFRSADTVLSIDCRNLPWRTESRAETYRVDAANDFALTATQSLTATQPALAVRLPTSAVCLVRLGRV